MSESNRRNKQLFYGVPALLFAAVIVLLAITDKNREPVSHGQKIQLGPYFIGEFRFTGKLHEELFLATQASGVAPISRGRKTAPERCQANQIQRPVRTSRITRSKSDTTAFHE